MSDPVEPIDVPGSPDVPMARAAGGLASGLPGPRPIFEVEEDRCPKCGAPMGISAVVCLKCGYDQRANVVREVETGVVEVAAPAAEPAPGVKEFVVPGRLSPKALAITGVALTAGAMVSSGVWRPHGSFWLVAGWGLYTLYSVAINSVTGVAAVAVAARLDQKDFGRLDYAAARMFVCFALFEGVQNVRPNLGYWLLTGGVPLLGAAVLYFGAVMVLFRKDLRTAGIIALAHLILWLLVSIGPTLYGALTIVPGKAV